MPFIQNLFKSFGSSAVVWSWIFNGTRMASGILLLPLLVHKLTGPDFGMFYAFASITALIPIIDFGFRGSIGRFVGYAMGGATELKAQGVHATKGSKPNYNLLGQLLFTTKQLYKWLSVLSFIILGVLGTVMVGLRVHETANPTLTWVAWGVTLVSGILEIYFAWWSAYLLGMNEVLFTSRLSALINTLKLALGAILLLFGFGLLAVAMAGLVSSVLSRQLARRRCLQLLPADLAPSQFDVMLLLKKIWPNSWRTGVLILSSGLRNYVITYLCIESFGLEANGTLGVSIQIIGIIQSLASVWTSVKWPIVTQYFARQDHEAIRKVLWPRFWLQFLTFGLLCLILIPAAPLCISWISSTKQVLPLPWMALLALNALLELQYSFWTTLQYSENRIPYLWSTLITNGCTLLLAVVLLKATSIGLLALVIAPLIVSSIFIYWYWPLAAAAHIKTTWWQFCFSRPPEAAKRAM